MVKQTKSLFKEFDLLNSYVLNIEHKRLKSLCQEIKMGELNISPFYQREFVWTTNQQKAYVQAFFEGKAQIKLSLIALGHSEERDSGFVWEVLDGRQRLTTLIKFMNNELSVYDDIYFDDLIEDDKDKFLRSRVELSIYSKIRFDDFSDKEKIELFLILNDLGTRVSENHLELLRKKIKSF